MKEDVTKLPKWAQNRIMNLESKLEADRKDYQGKLRELAGEEDSDILLGREFGEHMPLPKHSSITFLLPGVEKDSITVSNGKRGVCIRKYHGRLNINPEASNSAYVS